MEGTRLLEILALVGKLKDTTRHSWTAQGRQESVAEHSWRMALMAYLMKDEFPDLDIAKVILMCVVHDLGEAFTGDIPAFDKTDKHRQIEADLLTDFIAGLPAPYCLELAQLFEEMEALVSPEAQLYKAIDKLEVVVQHNEADLATWLPLEWDLNLSHGTKETNYSPYLKALRAIIKADSVAKMAAHQQADKSQNQAIDRD